MRRLPLAAWLALLTVGVVLLVVATLASAALALFGRLADENARSRVRLAALGAVEGVEREADAAATTARLLAERPTLLRLTTVSETQELQEFLDRFRLTGGVDGCAVFRNGSLVAAAPPALPWAEVRRRAADGSGVQPPLPGEAAPLVSGVAPLTGIAVGDVMVLRRLDAAFAQRLTEQVGLPVRILAAPGPDGSADERTAAGYRSRLPIGHADAAWVEVALASSEIAGVVRPLRRRFVLVALASTLLAIAVGVLAGRRLSRPLGALRRSAQRIASGDLVTPISPAAGAEMSALTGSMEEMRQRLRTLTAELERREAEAQALLAGIVEGVFAVDGERRIQYLNPQAAALLGLTAEEAVGRFCGDVLRPVDASGGRPCEDRCPIVHARSRGSSRAVEHLHLPRGRRTVVITSAPPAGASQVQVMRDETEIEAARRSRDAVLANVSHELKTPLAAQLASIELLRDGLAEMEPAAAAGLVASLERSALRLTRLIDNLLESVRIETGRATLRRIQVALEAVVDEAVAMTLPLLEQRRLRLDVARLAPLPPVTGDPGQLTQVLVNLLSNAQKFAPEGSTIRIGASHAAGSVSVWVEDAGPGVPAALSASIFDRFHRAGPEGDGMGLGLWIAKSIVERHGGLITVTSSRDGGARFTVSLPATEAA
ncbi:MAG: sensor histidine kinase [Thermoanaerobaculia bacterium]